MQFYMKMHSIYNAAPNILNYFTTYYGAAIAEKQTRFEAFTLYTVLWVSFSYKERGVSIM